MAGDPTESRTARSPSFLPRLLARRCDVRWAPPLRASPDGDTGRGCARRRGHRPPQTVGRLPTAESRGWELRLAAGRWSRAAVSQQSPPSGGRRAVVVVEAKAAPLTVRSHSFCREFLASGDGGGLRVRPPFEGQQLLPGSGLAPRAEPQCRRRPLPLLDQKSPEGNGGSGGGVGPCGRLQHLSGERVAEL